MKRLHLLRSAVCLLSFAVVVVTTSRGQTLTWQGTTGSTALSNSANWVSTQAPTESSDLVIATHAPATTIPNLLVGSNITVRSFTFDNNAGQYSSSLGLRIVSTTSSTNNTAQRQITFSTAGTIITALNNANMSFRSASIGANHAGVGNPATEPSLTLHLNFDGMGIINVDATSQVWAADGSFNTRGGIFTGTGGLTKTGAGLLRLSGNHTFTGGFTLQEGAVEFTTSGSAADGVITNTPFGTGTLTLQGGQLMASSDNGRTVYNDIHLDGHVAITSATANRTGNFTMSTTGGGRTTLLSDSTLNIAQTVNWNQDISGNASLTKTGAGTLHLNGDNTHTGGTIVAEGTLSGNVAGGALGIGFGATYALGGADQTVATLSGAGAVELGANTLTAQSGFFTGSITGAGGVIKSGGGALTLTGNNNYAGATTIAAGVIDVHGDAAIGTGAITFTGGTLQYGSGQSSDFSARIADSSGAVAINTNGSNVTFGTALAATNTGGLAKSGAGTLALADGNAFTGAVSVTGGTLSGDLNGNALTVGSGATYALGGANRSIGALGGAGSIHLGIHTLTTSSAASSTHSGVISGSGGLVKQGSGTLTLTGANSYSGGTAVQGGTLVVSSSSIQGTILNNAHVQFDQASHGTFAGNIAGLGALTKTGAGTLTLTGNNNYSGGTTVSAGTLAGNTTSLKGDIANHAAVTFNQTADGTYSGNLTGSGTLAKTGAGKLTLAGSTAHTGSTTVAEGRLQVNTVTMVGNLINDALVIWDQLTEGDHHGTITGTGALEKTGAGTLRLLGNNSYTGGTTVSAGTLEGTTSSLQGAIVNHAAVVFDQAAAGTYAGAMSGTGALMKNGLGALTLTGPNTYSGGTQLNAGSLIGTTASLQGPINANATLVFNQASNGTFNGTIAGTGTLQKLGTGTLTLEGQHAFAGATHIDAGALRLNAFLNSSLHVAGQGRLTGDGFVAGHTFVNGIHAPGDEVGAQAFGGNLTYQAGAVVQLQFLTLDLPVLTLSDAVPSAGFDQIFVGGNLDFAGATLLSLAFNAPGSTINWADLMWDETQSWTIFVANGSITGIENANVVSATWLDVNGVSLNSLRHGASFALQVDGQHVNLVYSAVPEPATYAALLGLAALALVAYRRRRAAA